MSEPTHQERIVEAFMALAAEMPYERIGLMDIAGRAGVSLAELRDAFDTIPDILVAFARGIDRKVLAASADDMSDEPARERLFDVLMRRFDELKPYRPALRTIAAAFRRAPLLGLAWNRHAVTSMAWMLAAARIPARGLPGRLKAQGLVFAMAQAFRVFLDDDDEGLARTMSELDRRLREGERRLDLLCRFAPSRRRRPSRPSYESDAEYSI